MNPHTLVTLDWIRRRVPVSWVAPIATLFADAAWLTLPSQRRAVAANLARLTDRDDPRERRRLCRETFRNFALCCADVLSLADAQRRASLVRIDISGVPTLRRALARGRGAIIVGAHHGNFELGAVAFASGFDVPTTVVVEAISPDRDAFFARLRGSTGLRLLAGSPSAPREALRRLRCGEVLIVAGDRPIQSRRQLTVPFARGRRAVPTGPAWLALRSDAPILPGYTVLSDDVDPPYRAAIEPEVSTDDLGGDPIATLTRRIAARLSSIVERYPDQWFVADPNWQEDPGTGA